MNTTGGNFLYIVDHHIRLELSNGHFSFNKKCSVNVSCIRCHSSRACISQVIHLFIPSCQKCLDLALNTSFDKVLGSY